MTHPGRPPVEPWELSAWYRQLKAAVLVFEEAWEAGELADTLADDELRAMVGERVHGAYARLGETEPPRRSPFRRASIHALLDPVKELLEEPRVIFAARGLPRAAPDGAELAPHPAGGLVVAETAEPVTLGLHQAVAARFWRIGFGFEEAAHERWFANYLVRLALERLASDLDGLLAVERWLRKLPKLNADVHIVPDEEGRGFEQLMIDLVNVDAPVAARASLEEDFLEKTDLRVRYPGLGRRHGARVQVTMVIQRDRLDRKLARIRHAEEFVILSPRTLAEAVAGPTGVEILHRGEVNAIWQGLAHVPASVEELARALREVFTTAIGRALEDPRGPAAFVPEPFARLVRSYVEYEARRTTKTLRSRVGGEPKPPSNEP